MIEMLSILFSSMEFQKGRFKLPGVLDKVILSLFLFLPVVDIISQLITKGVDGNIIELFKIG